MQGYILHGVMLSMVYCPIISLIFLAPVSLSESGKMVGSCCFSLGVTELAQD